MYLEEAEIATYYHEFDALPLEYKQDYGIARRNINISNLMNNPKFQGEICISSPNFSEKISEICIKSLGASVKIQNY